MEFNILFTSIGRRVALVKHFRSALKTLGIEGRLIGADMTMTAPAIHFTDVKYKVPSFHGEGYIRKLLEICEKEKVRLLIPLNDYELLILSKNKGVFSDIGTVVHISEPEVVEVAIDKVATDSFFRKNGIDCPRTYDIQGASNFSKLEYPCFLKPRYGSASKGIQTICSYEELLFYRKRSTEYVLQECVQGAEYTLDVFVDAAQRVRCVVPRRRIEVRSGEVSKGVTVRNGEIIEAGKEVTQKLGKVFGVINLQCFLLPEDGIKFIEINPRFGGGIPLSIVVGADFPRWLIEMVLGNEPTVDPMAWQEGVYMLRWDDAIFVAGSEVES